MLAQVAFVRAGELQSSLFDRPVRTAHEQIATIRAQSKTKTHQRRETSTKRNPKHLQLLFEIVAHKKEIKNMRFEFERDSVE